MCLLVFGGEKKVGKQLKETSVFEGYVADVSFSTGLSAQQFCGRFVKMVVYLVKKVHARLGCLGLLFSSTIM